MWVICYGDFNKLYSYFDDTMISNFMFAPAFALLFEPPTHKTSLKVSRSNITFTDFDTVCISEANRIEAEYFDPAQRRRIYYPVIFLNLYPDTQVHTISDRPWISGCPLLVSC